MPIRSDVELRMLASIHDFPKHKLAQNKHLFLQRRPQSRHRCSGAFVTSICPIGANSAQPRQRVPTIIILEYIPTALVFLVSRCLTCAIRLSRITGIRWLLSFIPPVKVAALVSFSLAQAFLAAAELHEDPRKNDIESDMDTGTQEVESEALYPPTYFSLQEHTALIYGHVAVMVIAWMAILPVGRYLCSYDDLGLFLNSTKEWRSCNALSRSISIQVTRPTRISHQQCLRPFARDYV